MRVTHGMLARTTLADLNDSVARLSKVQSQMASGLQRAKPSDDVVGAARSQRLTSSIEGLRQLQSNVADATALTDATETALSGLTDIVARARTLAIQGGNGATDQTSRNAIAAEIDQLAEAAKDQLGVSVAGRYVFSGTATTTPPYAAGSDAYAGDGGTVAREIGVGVSVAVNQRADDLIGSGGGDGRLLSILRAMAADLRAGDAEAVRTTHLADLDVARDTVLDARATNGAVAQRLEATTGQLRAFEEQSERARGLIDATDYAKAAIEYSTGAAAYQAALKAGAQIMPMSLMDFLR